MRVEKPLFLRPTTRLVCGRVCMPVGHGSTCTCGAATAGRAGPTHMHAAFGACRPARPSCNAARLDMRVHTCGCKIASRAGGAARAGGQQRCEPGGGGAAWGAGCRAAGPRRGARFYSRGGGAAAGRATGQRRVRWPPPLPAYPGRRFLGGALLPRGAGWRVLSATARTWAWGWVPPALACAFRARACPYHLRCVPARLAASALGRPLQASSSTLETRHSQSPPCPCRHSCVPVRGGRWGACGATAQAAERAAAELQGERKEAAALRQASQQHADELRRTAGTLAEARGQARELEGKVG